MNGWQNLPRVTAPTAVVDLDAFESNLDTLVARANDLPIRVASKSVRVPGLLRRALEHPGYEGVLAFSAAEAVFLVQEGVCEDVLVAYPTVDRDTLTQVAADEQLREAITFMVDAPEHIDLLAECVGEGRLRVALDVDCSLHLGPMSVGVHRSSIRTADHAAHRARLVEAAKGLDLVAVMFYEAQVAGVPDDKFGIGPVKRMSNKQLVRRRQRVMAAVRPYGRIRFVNGGGTGSLHTTSLSPEVTELAAGSGLFMPTSFDGFEGLTTRPAAYFVTPVTRKPAPDVATTFAGGYIASGAVDATRQPTPTYPEGLKYFGQEGAGEVQSPVRGEAAKNLRIGDNVWFRHAKAGEMCERFDEVLLVREGEIVGRMPTYRGLGRNFG